MKDLIDFYRLHDVPNEENVQHLKLVHPIQYKRLSVQSMPPNFKPMAEPPNSSDNRRNMGNRSMSVVAPPTVPLSATSPAHRYSIDSNMSSVKWNSNGTTGGSPQQNGGMKIADSPKQAAAMATSPNLGVSPNNTSVPQLPLNKPKKKERRFGFGFLKRKTSSSSDSKTRLSSLEERAPAPLPPKMEKDNSHYYSVVNPEDVDRSGDLIEHIAQFERPGDDRCECGLTFEESELPGGWTMHLSQDQNTFGLLFFMGPQQETEWKLPFDVSLQLTADQQDNIRRLIAEKERRNRYSSGSSGSTGMPGNRLSGTGQMSHRREATEHECSSDEVFPTFTL